MSMGATDWYNPALAGCPTLTDNYAAEVVTGELFQSIVFDTTVLEPGENIEVTIHLENDSTAAGSTLILVDVFGLTYGSESRDLSGATTTDHTIVVPYGSTVQVSLQGMAGLDPFTWDAIDISVTCTTDPLSGIGGCDTFMSPPVAVGVEPHEEIGGPLYYIGFVDDVSIDPDRYAYECEATDSAFGGLWFLVDTRLVSGGETTGSGGNLAAGNYAADYGSFIQVRWRVVNQTYVDEGPADPDACWSNWTYSEIIEFLEP